MMQEQLDRSRRETQGVRDMTEKVNGILEGLSQAKLAETEEVVSEVEIDDGAEAWEVLEREFA